MSALPKFRAFFKGDQDRSDWGDGPWADEPDKVVWVDEATDLDCMAVRNHGGAWCGYVGVEPGHRLHGVIYQEADETIWVHGGLTFSAGCAGDEEAADSICHLPRQGHSHDTWWLGFDLAHSGDLAPGFEARMREVMSDYHDFHQVYRDLGYVVREVAHLASQVAES